MLSDFGAQTGSRKEAEQVRTLSLWALPHQGLCPCFPVSPPVLSWSFVLPPSGIRAPASLIPLLLPQNGGLKQVNTRGWGWTEASSSERRK